ncbi:MAG: heat-inducible transcription repressor HrcA, partial [Acidobacteria bacterium]|nr:heat-inducible transcription repressor HrcA [Acidobacteriota bacterium]
MRAYVETGEPISSRVISKRDSEQLSTATIRNVMADLEDEGYLYQPHTSAGRIPTAAAFRCFVQDIAQRATLGAEDRERIGRELNAANTPDELMERASQVLATISHGLGIVVTPPINRTVLEHIRFLLLPDGRLLVVLISRGGQTRDKVVRFEHNFAQPELDRTANYLNSNFKGRTLDDIRAELLQRLESERERYDKLAGNALALCSSEVLDEGASQQVFVGGAAQMAAAPEIASQEQLRDLLGAIEEKKKLVALLTTAIETPEPVHVQIGLDEMNRAGRQLALISAPYALQERVQGTLGILGPMRMEYERVITAIAFMARLFGEKLEG